MAEQTGKFLTELPELTTPIEDDLMYIVDDDTSKRITLKNLKSVVGGEDVTGTASGAVATFMDGGDDKPMKSLVVDVEATQSGSGTPSPSNVRPIVGRSEVNVSVSGKNLISPNIADYLTYGSYKYFKIPSYKEGDYIMSFTDKDTSIDISGCYIGFMSNYPTENSQYRWCISNGTIQANTTNTSAIDNVTKCDTIIAYPNNEATFNKIFARYNVQVERGATATEYTPYITPEVTTIPLDRTVYGGTLDVTRGILTVTKKYATFNDISTWTYDSARTRFQTGHITDMKTVAGSVVNDIITSCTQMYSNNQAWDGHIDGASWTSDDYFYVSMHDYTSVTDLLNAIGDEQIVYTLATPQTFNLTKEQIQTLLGQNYVSHDGGGNIKVVYIRDLDIVINDLINRVTALENE